MRTGKVTKKKAEELAKQLLGTGKLMKEDEYGYYFQSGAVAYEGEQEDFPDIFSGRGMV